jgi:uncharacterized protein (DUF2147 family)
MNMYSLKWQSAGLLLVLASILTLSAQTATAANNKAVYGYWKTLDRDTGKVQSLVKLFEYEGKLVGKVVKQYPLPGAKPNTVCTECSGKQKGKPVVGLVFFWGFEQEEGSTTKWVDGTILNPQDGKTYNGEAELSADGQTLTVYGYVSFLVKLGGNSTWKRATAEETKGL